MRQHLCGAKHRTLTVVQVAVRCSARSWIYNPFNGIPSYTPHDTMGILDELCEDSTWDLYLETRVSSGYMSKHESESLSTYIGERRYRSVVDKAIFEGPFPIPEKRFISKSGTSKKRAIYTFGDDEMLLLKVMASLLHRYDHMFSDSLFSFRKDIGVRDAVRRLSTLPGLKDMYAYKVDVSDYFNSIRWDTIRDGLKMDLDDPGLMRFLDSLFGDRRVMYDGSVMEEDKGAMAGVPLSAFLANYCLRDLDREFDDSDTIYMRYSDDILVVARNMNDVMNARDVVLSHIRRMGLTVNPNKEALSSPGDPLEFLGFRFEDGIVDISSVTVDKMKARIRRSGRSIRRWMLRKGVDSNKALRVMIRKFDRKFFGNGGDGINWIRWYFPVIDTDVSLKTIDEYLQQWCRYVVTGRHSGSNHDHVPYEALRMNGYRTLVCEYHRFRDR